MARVFGDAACERAFICPFFRPPTGGRKATAPHGLGFEPELTTGKLVISSPTFCAPLSYTSSASHRSGLRLSINARSRAPFLQELVS